MVEFSENILNMVNRINCLERENGRLNDRLKEIEKKYNDLLTTDINANPTHSSDMLICVTSMGEDFKNQLKENIKFLGGEG